MLNPTHVKNIIRTTLKKLGVHEGATESLILGTFLVESYLTDLHGMTEQSTSQEPARYGFMMMSKDRIADVLDWLKFDLFKFKAKDACGTDITAYSSQELCEFCKTNISLMIFFTYCWYAMTHNQAPDDTIEALGVCYNKFYAEDKCQDNVDYFKEIFPR